MEYRRQVSGNIIDIYQRKIFPGTLFIHGNRIEKIEENTQDYPHFILPGFIDAHIHIESSMLVPYEFARIALLHGTVATVSDPHEIANVCGMQGIEYMIENAKGAKLKFNFGAPSCVPATSFETTGAIVSSEDIEELMKRPDIKYLSEMMNYPGVLNRDKEVIKKIESAHRYGKPVDGHAPGLRGDQARQYIQAGISTDHECFTLEEALDKLSGGMKILIREGSAAKNFEALHSIITTHTREVMLCSDDKHPDDLLEGHINQLVVLAIHAGHDLFDVLQCACVNPVQHYHLDVGLLKKGDPADFIVVDNLTTFKVLQTFIDGECVAEKGVPTLPSKMHPVINSFTSYDILPEAIEVNKSPDKIKVIEALDGQLITNCLRVKPNIQNGVLISDRENDILKIVVANRYHKARPAVGFIKGFGLKLGAMASTVAHDSHNVIAVGVNDQDILKAIEVLMQSGGGLSLVHNNAVQSVALPIAGLMSDKSCEEIGKAYASISNTAREMGSRLKAPYMTLSFMALLVIPHFKIGDKGLFDGDVFQLTEI